MKTIMDAVNELKGDIKNARQGDQDFGHLVVCKWSKKLWVSQINRTTDMHSYICCDIEFVELVAELSHASWIEGASLAEYQAADKEVLTVEGETVEVDGMVYEIGKLYLFSDGNGDFEIGELSAAGDINDGNGFMYQSKVKLRKSNKYEWWNKLSTIDAQIGTITPAPVKLVDGAAYELDYLAGKFVGIYSESDGLFYLSHNRSVNKSLCKVITRLVPEAK